MKKEYSKEWFSSAQIRKQRKARANAPLSMKRKLLAAPLSKELKAEKKQNAAPVRTGDEVKIMRGKHSKQTGLVESVDVKAGKIYVKGLVNKRTDGKEAMKPIDPSNVLIIKLKEDPKRFGEKVMK